MKPRNIFLATLKKKAGLPMDEPAVPILEKAGILIERDGRAIEALRLRGNFGAAAAGEPVPSFVGPKDPPTVEEIAAFVEAEKSRGYNDDVARKAREVATPKEPAAPAVDYEALKDQGLLIHQSNATGPSGCLENQEALRLYSDEALVEELRVRGWTVSCTKSI